MKWEKTKLGSHVNLISGPAFKSHYFTDDPSDIPLVKGDNLGQGQVLWERSKYWPKSEAESYRKFMLKSGDVILAMDRPWVTAGLKFAVISEKDPQALLVQRVARLRSANGLNPRFLGHVVASKDFCSYIKGIMGGTNVPHISGDQIRGFEFFIPSYEEQSQISKILSSYNDLIENNRRRIQLLEESARLLYREWFVHFRFPGHEHTKIVDDLPEGWERKKIVEVCETVGGGTPSTKQPEYWDGDITWVVPTDVTRNDSLVLLDSARKITEKGLRKSSAKIVPENTILMTSRASVGYFALVDRAVCTNQGFINLIPHEEEFRMYLLFNLMDRVEEIRGNAKGTTYPEISKGRFREMQILVPVGGVSSMFSDHVTPVVDQVRCLKKQIRCLTQARDLLIPKLMNREIAV